MGLTSTEDTAGVAEVDLGDTSPSAVDAVYTDADTKLFAIRGVICKFPENVQVALHAENPVPLLSSDGKLIGSARVLPWEDGVIIAEGLFQYGCPERLSIEMGINHYFHPEMSEKFFYSQLLPTKERPTGVLVSVKKLVLSADARTDAYVEPVEPLSEEESPLRPGPDRVFEFLLGVVLVGFLAGVIHSLKACVLPAVVVVLWIATLFFAKE